MTRPNKILSETMTYNLTIEKKDYEELRKFSTSESESFNMQVSIADLIRTSVKLYIDDLKHTYKGKETDGRNTDRN